MNKLSFDERKRQVKKVIFLLISKKKKKLQIRKVAFFNFFVCFAVVFFLTFNQCWDKMKF